MIQAPGLTHKHYTWLEKSERDKHSSLLRTLVKYCRRKFYKIGTGATKDTAHNVFCCFLELR
jgi:hypothetical protein